MSDERNMSTSLSRHSAALAAAQESDFRLPSDCQPACGNPQFDTTTLIRCELQLGNPPDWS